MSTKILCCSEGVDPAVFIKTSLRVKLTINYPNYSSQWKHYQQNMEQFEQCHRKSPSSNWRGLVPSEERGAGLCIELDLELHKTKNFLCLSSSSLCVNFIADLLECQVPQVHQGWRRVVLCFSIFRYFPNPARRGWSSGAHDKDWWVISMGLDIFRQ